jgi:hypothetical protein
MNVASGSTIVLLGTAFFVITLAGTSLRRARDQAGYQAGGSRLPAAQELFD